MANVADTVAVPGSNIETGDGTNARTFTLPATPGMKIQSVVATVDNTAGGDTTATLTIRDQSGEVIATQRQDDVIPAADTGTASFALRLPGSKSGQLRFGRTNTGSFLDVITTTHGGSAGYGINLETTGASTSNGIRLVSIADILQDAATTWSASGATDVSLNATDAGAPVRLTTSNGAISLSAGTGRVSIGDNTLGKLAFFGGGGAVRQGTPVTLADVIAVLQAYNLVA